MATQNCDHLFKLIMVGDSQVGKTSLAFRFTDNVFSQGQKSTIGKELPLFRVTKFSGKVMSLRSVYTVKVVCRRYGMYHIEMTNQVSRRGEPRV